MSRNLKKVRDQARWVSGVRAFQKKKKEGKWRCKFPEARVYRACLEAHQKGCGWIIMSEGERRILLRHRVCGGQIML